MGLADYALVLGVWGLAVASPGPDLLLVLHQSIAHSRISGVAAAIGIVVGVTVWIALALLGLDVLLATNEPVLRRLQMLGGIALVMLGVWGLRPQRERTGAEPSAGGSTPAAFLSGVTTNLANPKALVFFGTLFVTVLPDDATGADHRNYPRRRRTTVLLRCCSAGLVENRARIAARPRESPDAGGKRRADRARSERCRYEPCPVIARLVEDLVRLLHEARSN